MSKRASEGSQEEGVSVGAVREPPLYPVILALPSPSFPCQARESKRAYNVSHILL